jgi:hypothetical protein
VVRRYRFAAMNVIRDASQTVGAALRRLGLTADVASGVAESSQPTPDPLDQLKKLAELRDSDAITAAEYEETKRKLLAKVSRDAAR